MELLHKSLTKLIFSFIVLNFVLLEGALVEGKSAYKDAGTTSGAFLRMGVGPRAVGMGGAFTAVADDIYAMYWNPAGLSLLKYNEISSMYNRWLLDGSNNENIHTGYIGYVYPYKDIGAIGVSINYLDSGAITKTIENPDGSYGGTDGTFKATDMVVSVAYSYVFSNRFLLGANVKAICSKYMDESAQGYAIDVGGLYKIFIPNLTMGICVQNIGTKMKFIEEDYGLPLNVKAGLAYKILDEKLLLACDISKYIHTNYIVNIGSEFKLFNRFALRAGTRYKTDNNDLVDFPNNISAGFGVEVGKLQIDYAYTPYGDLGSMHKLAFSCKFGVTFEDKLEK